MIFNAFERMMAIRYLRARRKEGLVSVIAGFSVMGICLGVATLVIVMSVMNGFRQELLGRILGLNAHIIATTGGPVRDYDALVASLRDVPGSTGVYPAIEGQVLVSANGVAGGALLKAMDPADLTYRPLLVQSVVAGAAASLATDDTVMIGGRMAGKYGVGVGDTLTLIAPQGVATAFGTVPRVREYRIAAVFDFGMYEYDSGFVYMSLKAAQSFLRMGPTVTHIEILTDTPDNMGPTLAELKKRVDPHIFLIDWTMMNAGFFNDLEVERNVMFLILTMIILVAALNIISGLIMLVKDKGRDIAILRTMGAGRGVVMRIFFLAGASVGFLGTGLGLTLGLVISNHIEAVRQILQTLTGSDLFSAEIYFLSQMPARIDVGDVLSITFMALGLSLLATLYPSWRAARLDPVEALRYE